MNGELKLYFAGEVSEKKDAKLAIPLGQISGSFLPDSGQPVPQADRHSKYERQKRMMSKWVNEYACVFNLLLLLVALDHLIMLLLYALAACCCPPASQILARPCQPVGAHSWPRPSLSGCSPWHGQALP